MPDDSMTDSHKYNGSFFLILHEGAQLICPGLWMQYLLLNERGIAAEPWKLDF